jgi:hypothetical protein
MRQEFIQFNHTKSFLAQTKYEEGGRPLSSSQGGRGLAHKEKKKQLFWFFLTFCALANWPEESPWARKMVRWPQNRRGAEFLFGGGEWRSFETRTHIHHNYINLKTSVRLTNVFILCLG